MFCGNFKKMSFLTIDGPQFFAQVQIKFMFLDHEFEFEIELHSIPTMPTPNMLLPTISEA